RATLNQGDPDLVQSLIDSSPYAKKYTSGFLCFAETDLSQEIKDRLMADFEKALLPGLDKDQYSILWVEHLDKGRLELNFVIPNIELHSGKRLQPYYHFADNPRIDAWRTIKNLELGLHDPDDPANQQGLVSAKDTPSDAKEIQQLLTDGLLNLAQSGAIRSRKGLIGALESKGFEIARVTAKSISIKNPESGK
ncbi:relaxase/mobilization nuclease domain-containing protein, partial [Vibrio parahaemolyticus]|nr:relaxase/mobilization nuclease domain-containing protein [Vibrio parahaemolyticus]